MHNFINQDSTDVIDSNHCATEQKVKVLPDDFTPKNSDLQVQIFNLIIPDVNVMDMPLSATQVLNHISVAVALQATPLATEYVITNKNNADLNIIFS